MTILSVFFAEFHYLQGPVVMSEFPRGYFMSTAKNEDKLIEFDSISEYIIPKNELTGHLVSV